MLQPVRYHPKTLQLFSYMYQYFNKNVDIKISVHDKFLE